MISNFAALEQSALHHAADKTVRMAVVNAHDPTVLEAVRLAVEKDLVEVSLIGPTDAIRQAADEVGFTVAAADIVEAADDVAAAAMGTAFCRAGKADVLMKGYIHTDDFLRAVVDRDKGLRQNVLMSHVFLHEDPKHARLRFITDAAMNPLPDLTKKAQILLNCLYLTQIFQLECPKVAALGAVEVVNPKMPATMDAAILAKMAERRQFSLPCIVDGPFALDNAISEAAARHKKITSPVAGHPDVLLMPNLSSGNIYVKSLVYNAGHRIAGVVIGATHPIVLTSRADSAEAKYLSIATAVQMVGMQRTLRLKVGKVSY